MIRSTPKVIAPLDPYFEPAALWERAYRRTVAVERAAEEIYLTVYRGRHSCGKMAMRIFKHENAHIRINERAAARWAKFAQWRFGGDRVAVSGCDALAEAVSALYGPGKPRAFDFNFFSSVYDGVRAPLPRVLGGYWDGCRVGFDLGASDRKCAAVKDGEVLFTEEVAWDPGSWSDPSRHLTEIKDSVARAARHLPRVDAIGGSTAGVLFGEDVRRSSIFLGVPERDFETGVRPIFGLLRSGYPNAAFAVANDGAVTALSGAQALGRGRVLGLAMGSSFAAGYVDADGRLPDSIDELAFVPIDERCDAPQDEWSKERGCAAQYLSQRGVARLAKKVKMAEDGEPAPDVLKRIQEKMRQGDKTARDIYRTIGVYFGYAVAQFSYFYDVRDVLVLGRVMTGEGGAVLLQWAGKVLREEFPEIADGIVLRTPNERDKRHGQAVAAASLAPGPAA